MGTDPVLVVSGLTVEVVSNPHPRPVVRDVSLTVMPGEVLGLIGESGSGKSMTCLSVMNLLPKGAHVAAGDMRMPGRDAIRRGRDAAMIMQNPSSCFDPVMTVRGHFKETLAGLGLSWRRGLRRALDCLAEAGFEEPESLLPLYPFQMSGGMLQRVMVALAMLGEPRLLLADEPTTDLDMPAQAKVLDLIDRLRATHGLGVLLVTHDLSVAARLADRIAVMRAGRILETGPASRIFDHPVHDYTRTLIRAHFDLHESLCLDAGEQEAAA